MNKRGITLIELLVIIAIVSILGSILFVAFQEAILLKKCRKGNMDSCQKLGDNNCGLQCQQLGYDYLKWDTSGWGSQECWCLDSNKPVQIW